ncbi:beta-ketoacyl-[acyl-carrier-protein] synthase family protein [Paraglaciecola arctica]|uniref:beta-ketoacyl-[acyl-carrier-protein] synthase family protein n=1 Tax=Paraglaciecola arctica TaxID=1128911 RepID=UPI001C07A6C5|nr:beta-ketoacyl-[acyl-carrier-protein] synthase family protein [Paraglaciecola arctica]MBU3003498.1 beta-ketoacyl-[acyl-carrier-protein] synthase family protein [Paraglaciecola arctica]
MAEHHFGQLDNIYINDFGLINALGGTLEEVSLNLFAGSQQGFVERNDILPDAAVFVAEVASQLPDIKTYPKHFHSRNNQLALQAYNQIAATVESLKNKYSEQRIGVILGTSTSGIAQGESAMEVKQQAGAFPAEYDYRVQEISNVAEFISLVAGLSGVSMAISTACSSSAKTFITASELIRAGVIDAAIVGGVDSLCSMTVNGFSALESTSSGICKPSSVNRDGINIGEGAALAIISKDKSDLRLLAGGESSDAHHMSAPHPQGRGAIDAMQQALNNAQLTSQQIDYINLHGTATPKNDSMEAIAVAELFPHQPFVSSSKGSIGHTLGAAGATEIGFCCLVLRQQKLAPHVWDHEVDPELPVLNWVENCHDNTSKIRCCLSNSFAFGGNNVSLIVGREYE